MWPQSKKWVKNLKICDRAYHFGVVGCQNRIKNGRVMPIESWGKSGVLAYFWLKIGYVGHIFWDMDFKFDLPTIHINIKAETQLEANWTQMDHFILYNGQKKWPYLDSRFCVKRVCSKRFYIFQYFSMKFSRINVELNFALNLLLGLFLFFRKKLMVRGISEFCR